MSPSVSNSNNSSSTDIVNLDNTATTTASSLLKQQQQSDYEASLAKDRAKEWDRMEREAELERQRQLEQQHTLERQELIEKAKQILASGDGDEGEPQVGVRLAVQLPDGKKISRRFTLDTPTAVLYALVDVSYLQEPNAFTDYRLQSLHPMFYIPRHGALSDHPFANDTQHKLYVDTSPLGVTTEESAGAESDVENSERCD